MDHDKFNAALRKQRAVSAFLNRLKRFIRVTPLELGRDVPKHTIEWFVRAGEGATPHSTVMQMLIAHPELWLELIPDEVVLVPRDRYIKDLEMLLDLSSNSSCMAQPGGLLEGRRLKGQHALHMALMKKLEVSF